MRSNKIRVLNNNVHAGDTLLVKARQYNEMVEDLEFLYPRVDQRFEGKIFLGRSYTQYANYIVNVALEVKLDNELTTGASAEIRLIGDNVITPTFSSAFTISSTSDAYDPTLNKVNKVVFYYDGVAAFYSITVL
jgi:hypothetical protein